MTAQEKANLMGVIEACADNVEINAKIVIALKRLSEFIEDKRSMTVAKEIEKLTEEVVNNCSIIVAICKTMAIDEKSDIDSIMKTLAKIKEDTEV